MNQYVPLRVKIRLWLKSFLPQKLFSLISKIWINTLARFFKVQNVLERYTAEFISKNPKVVQAGPFIGLAYVDKAVGSNYLHKLIGSYESILHPFIDSIKTKKFDTIIDIGAAEGYYLVGFGRMFKEAKLVGFEIEQTGRDLISELYSKNQLNNKLILLGEATAENASEYITDSTLLVCDCEGAELDILNPDKNNNWLKVDTAIIELHDFIRPGIKESLIKRFFDTHNISIIPYKMADVTLFPFLDSIKNKAEQYEVLRERGWQEQEWMILTRK